MVTDEEVARNERRVMRIGFLLATQSSTLAASGDRRSGQRLSVSAIIGVYLWFDD
jgi:hypothetical protein